MGRQKRRPGRQTRRNPRGRNTRYEAPSPQRPRVKLNRDAVWELPGRLGMSWNEPAHRSYGNAADRHLPPSRGRPNQGFHSLPEEVQPGTGPRPQPRTPRASLPACPRGSTVKETPHHSGEHGQPQRPRTQGCGNTGLPGEFPAGIWSEMRQAPCANPVGHVDQITQITQYGSRFTLLPRLGDDFDRYGDQLRMDPVETWTVR